MILKAAFVSLSVYIPTRQEASEDIIRLTAPGGLTFLTLTLSPTRFLSLYIPHPPPLYSPTEQQSCLNISL